MPAAWVAAAAGVYSALKGSKKSSYVGGLPTAAFDSWDVQRYLPPELRHEYSTLGQGTLRHAGNADLWGNISTGLQGIGELMANPGGLSANVADSIKPRLAMESERIGQNFRGIGANQAGAAARTNQPVSIKNALASALDVSQERAQRDARRTAMVDSEQLRRQDLMQTYQVLGLILDYINSARGIGANAQQNAQQMAQQGNAATTAALGNFASSIAQYNKPSGSGGSSGGSSLFPSPGDADYTY